MNAAVYRANRTRFSLAELTKCRGQWIALALDGSRIIAASGDLATLDNLVRMAGEDPERVALEFIDLEDCSLGGAGCC